VPHTDAQRDVPIALLYQQAALHAHLKHALSDLGAQVVYDAPAATFDRGALDASGARVVVVNLDPEVEEEIDHIYDLLEDDSLNVIFNDAEVSSRLEGWDQARWARHLAAKILGLPDTNPPRPAGAEAVAVRVRAAGPERVGSVAPDLGFDLLGAEFNAALHADTAEALSRTRAALTTTDEPIHAELIAVDDKFQEPPAQPSPRAATDAPTLELPRPMVSDERPTLELPRVTTPVTAPVAAADDFLGGDAEDEFASLSLDFSVAEASVADSIVDTLDGDGDELTAKLDDLGIDFDAPLGAEFDEEVPATITDVAISVETATVDDEFAGAFGALDLVAFDDEPTPNQRDAAPPQGLDDLLLDLKRPDSDAPAAPAAPLGAKAATPAALAAGAAAPPAAQPTPPPAATRAALPTATLSLADDDAVPAPAPAARAAAPERDLARFDLSHLSLAPLDGDEPAPAQADQGRAQFRIDTADRKPAAVPAPAAPAVAPTQVEDDFDLGALDFVLPSDGASPAAGGVDDAADAFVTVLDAGAGDDDLFAEFESLLGTGSDAQVSATAAASGSALRCWVLGASIGGPEAVREFLAQMPADADVVFLLAQHMGADFVDLMTQQLARATPLPVRSGGDGMRAAPGEVIVVPLADRLLIESDGEMRVVSSAQVSPYSPSIDQVLRDVADRFGADAGAIIFSGMAHDAIEGARYLHERGGQVWAQDPSTCVISSMVDGACEAGVVSVVAAPAELARRFRADILGRA
jgi:chemotaxis response regulator CheB